MKTLTWEAEVWGIISVSQKVEFSFEVDDDYDEDTALDAAQDEAALLALKQGRWLYSDDVSDVEVGDIQQTGG